VLTLALLTAATCDCAQIDQSVMTAMEIPGNYQAIRSGRDIGWKGAITVIGYSSDWPWIRCQYRQLAEPAVVATDTCSMPIFLQVACWRCKQPGAMTLNTTQFAKTIPMCCTKAGRLWRRHGVPAAVLWTCLCGAWRYSHSCDNTASVTEGGSRTAKAAYESAIPPVVHTETTHVRRRCCRWSPGRSLSQTRQHHHHYACF